MNKINNQMQKKVLIVTDGTFDCDLLRSFVAFFVLAPELSAVQQSNVLVSDGVKFQ